MKVITIGELLIDFIPKEKGVDLKGVNNFLKHAGGAPANVAAVVAKLGGESIFLGQVGQDSFGTYAIDKLKSFNVDTKYVHQTSKRPTSLSFVSLTNDGERDFIFIEILVQMNFMNQVCYLKKFLNKTSYIFVLYL